MEWVSENDEFLNSKTMKRYYYGEKDQINGPKPLHELQQLAKAGRLSWGVMVSETRSGPWKALDKVGMSGTLPPSKMRMSLAVWFDGIGFLNLFAGVIYIGRFMWGVMGASELTGAHGMMALSFFSAGLAALAIGEILARLREIAEAVR